mgnify:CR=1 FL=1
MNTNQVINLTTGLFLLFLAVGGNYMGETLGCQTQKILTENMYVKQLFIILQTMCELEHRLILKMQKALRGRYCHARPLMSWKMKTGGLLRMAAHRIALSHSQRAHEICANHQVPRQERLPSRATFSMRWHMPPV